MNVPCVHFFVILPHVHKHVYKSAYEDEELILLDKLYMQTYDMKRIFKLILSWIYYLHLLNNLCTHLFIHEMIVINFYMYLL